MFHLVDIGINLMNKQFENDREKVIKRAIENNVSQMIITGTSVKASEEGAKYAKKHQGKIYSTAGIHPHDARNFVENDIDVLKELLKEEFVVAVGECGLDFNRDFTPRNKQENVFEKQLELAREVKKPLFLHERDAHKRFVEIMNHHEDLIEKSVVHCFTGTKEEAIDYVNRGFYIGITGWVCDDRRGKELQEAVKHIPLDRIMIETDGPYLAPKNLKPRPSNWRNEPMYLPHIAKDLAKHMGVAEEKLIEATTKNARLFFGLN